jgi:RNA polymerase sigma-70 factor (sigma-E family)
VGEKADEESFHAYVSARRGALLRSAYLLTGDHHAAEDLVQTALFKTAMRWRRVAAGGDPEPYVRRVLYNEHVSAWRRRRHLTEVAVSPPDRAGAGAGSDDRVVLQEALARLTPKQRAVLVLRYFEDLTEVQTAAVLGCSPGTVKSQTRHALERLRVLAPDLVADPDRGSFTHVTPAPTTEVTP